MQSQNIRPPAVAGSFYPANVQKLRAMIEEFLKDADPPTWPNVRGIIVPHAGYIYSGPIAAFGFKVLQQQTPPPTRAFVMAPSHRVRFQGIALGDYEGFRTPLGEVPVDRETLEELADASRHFRRLPQAHGGEHSLEVQLPFLQTVCAETPIVPLLFGDVDAVAAGKVLADKVEPTDVIIVSSDLSHYHQYEEAKRRDRSFVDALLEGTRQDVAHGEACGRAPILTLMTVAEQYDWQPHLLDYRNSGDTAGGRREVVGYAAIAYTAAS